MERQLVVAPAITKTSPVDSVGIARCRLAWVRLEESINEVGACTG